MFNADLEHGVLKKTWVVGGKTNRFDVRIRAIIEELQGTYDFQKDHCFSCADHLVPTDYKKKSAGGIQGPRNHHLADIAGLNVSTTESIAAGLRTVVWN